MMPYTPRPRTLIALAAFLAVLATLLVCTVRVTHDSEVEVQLTRVHLTQTALAHEEAVLALTQTAVASKRTPTPRKGGDR